MTRPTLTKEELELLDSALEVFSGYIHDYATDEEYVVDRVTFNRIVRKLGLSIPHMEEERS